MADLFDYLAWRGDITFSVDPFNMVDNLLLCELAYIDFEGVLSEDPDCAMPIREVKERYFQLHTEDEILERDTLFRLAPLLLPEMAGSKRFSGTVLTNYVNLAGYAPDEQLSAVTFLLEDGTVFVAFRGTDDTIAGWKEDFAFSYKTHTDGQLYAADYLNRYFSQDTRRIRVGGHSKGGNFAVYASSFCDRQIQDMITEVYTNDGPGFLKEVTEQEGYERILPRIISFIPEQSVFGLLMHRRFSNTVIKSSAKGIMQHDALTWEVLRNHFAESEDTSKRSHFIEKTLSEWIESFTEEQREAFVDTLFDLLTVSNAETLDDLRNDLLRQVKDMLAALKDMDPEKKKVISDTILALFRTGGDVWWENLTQRRKEYQERVKNTVEKLTHRPFKTAKGTDMIQSDSEVSVNDMASAENPS